MSNTTRQVVINDPKLLSGKPAASIVKIAKSFSGNITASVGSSKVSAKSLGQFLSLSPQAGQTLSFSAATGDNCVLDEIVGVLIDNKIGSLGTMTASPTKESKEEHKEVDSKKEVAKEFILDKSITILMANGMHGRSATKLVKLAKAFAGKLEVSNDGQKFVMAKSLSELLSIGLKHGDTLVIRATADGSESSEATQTYFDKVVAEVESGLGEETVPLEATLLYKKDKDSASVVEKIALEKSVVTLMPNGMHARPATQLAKLAKGFAGKLEVSNGGEKFVMAKSLSKLLSIGLKHGDTLVIRATADGSESDEATQTYFDKVVAEVESGLGDETVPLKTTLLGNKNNQPSAEQSIETATRPAVDWSSFDIIADLPSDNNSTGIPASAGMAIAPAYVKTAPIFTYDHLSTNSVDKEQQKLTQSIEQAKADIAKLIEQTELDEIKGIFASHLEILDDPAILEEVEAVFNKEKLSAPAGWYKTIEQAAKEQERLTDKHLAQRAADFRDVGERVMAILCGVKTAEEPTTPYILIMDEVGPSDVASLDPKRVAGILTAVGGASAHSAIVARALGIPAVVGAGSHILEVANNTTLIIDGETGNFTISPDNNQVGLAKAEITQQLALKTEAKKYAHEKANTLDGHHVEIAANIGSTSETPDAVQNGAEAIGLFRTELVFMKETEVPNEAKQTEIYRQVFEDLEGRPLVVRTLDVGGDKPLPYIPIPHEDNPFLGMRGVRLSLRKPQLLRDQVIALLKAADNKHPLRIMFPMVGRIEEWRFAKGIVDEVLETYPCDDLQVGIMIEVPSAALMSHIFAREVDFFSVGTNDLTQYTMAIDRGHPVLSADASGLHPSVLGLIDLTVHNAHKHGKWVGVCGELAADAAAVPVLLGLGVDELSMSATSIPLVKAQIRKLNYADCKVLAKRALSAESSKVVRALVKQQQIQQLANATENTKDSKETKSKDA